MYAGGQGVVFLLRSLARAAIFQLAFCLHIHERAWPTVRPASDTISFAVSVCVRLFLSLWVSESAARASSLFAGARISRQCSIPSNERYAQEPNTMHLSELYTGGAHNAVAAAANT